jgi:hypothetical protein
MIDFIQEQYLFPPTSPKTSCPSNNSCEITHEIAHIRRDFLLGVGKYASQSDLALRPRKEASFRGGPTRCSSYSKKPTFSEAIPPFCCLQRAIGVSVPILPGVRYIQEASPDKEGFRGKIPSAGKFSALISGIAGSLCLRSLSPLRGKSLERENQTPRKNERPRNHWDL